ncbi:23645_t:CDS:2 [Dentiscutata erythropus]|uniref:23645_t:CDS:1 n=1 Tax=Dentiscutata erythropus TaxID=1348616 RepID=A0A9N9ARI4_9GLOM|nr:23645_t:CDS:2 [Dentiscutata erythropus]
MSSRPKYNNKNSKNDQNDKDPLATSNLISLLTAALNPAFYGIDSLETFSSCFQRLYKFAVSITGSTFTFDVKFFSLNIQVDPLVEVEDATVVLKFQDKLGKKGRPPKCQEKEDKNVVEKMMEDKLKPEDKSTEDKSKEDKSKEDKSKEDITENDESAHDHDDEDIDEPVKKEENMSKMLETLDAKLSKHPIAFHFLAFLMQCILAVVLSPVYFCILLLHYSFFFFQALFLMILNFRIGVLFDLKIASINVKVKPDTEIKKAGFEIERENLEQLDLQKEGCNYNMKRLQLWPLTWENIAGKNLQMHKSEKL